MLFQKSWDDANKDCLCKNPEKSARLVDIKSEGEQEFVQNLTNKKAAWIGQSYQLTSLYQNLLTHDETFAYEVQLTTLG